MIGEEHRDYVLGGQDAAYIKPVMPAKNPWISCKEKLPDTDGFYLVHRAENTLPTTRIFTDSEWKSTATVTHWMPLPPTPEYESG